MATEYIAHVTPGTANKNLAVTGNLVEIPYLSDLWLDFQVDSGLVLSGSDIATWTDAKSGNIIAPASFALNAPSADALSKLNNISTPLFAGTLNGNNLRKVNSITGSPTEATPTVYCLLYKPGAAESVAYGLYRCIFTLYHYESAAYTKLVEIVEHPVTQLISVLGGSSGYQAIGTGVLGEWNILIVELDYAADTFRASLNGGAVAEYNTLTGGAAYPVTRIQMGVVGESVNSQPFRGNIGAALAWKGVTFEDADFAQAYDYLVFKYGLT